MAWLPIAFWISRHLRAPATWCVLIYPPSAHCSMQGNVLSHFVGVINFLPSSYTTKRKKLFYRAFSLMYILSESCVFSILATLPFYLLLVEKSNCCRRGLLFITRYGLSVVAIYFKNKIICLLWIHHQSSLGLLKWTNYNF